MSVTLGAPAPRKKAAGRRKGHVGQSHDRWLHSLYMRLKDACYGARAPGSEPGGGELYDNMVGEVARIADEY